MDISDRIRLHRNQLGLSQAELAKAASVNVRQIARYEAGEQQPALNVARSMANVFGISLDELAGEVSHGLSADALRGFWVTAYQFHWKNDIYHHADITQINPQSSRRLTATNYLPHPRTEDQTPAFLNEIEAELINRHVIGRWKNVSDTRYFGSLQLAALAGESILNGYYTSYLTDTEVDAMPWTWVRLDPVTLSDVEWEAIRLNDPADIHNILEHATEALALSDVAEEGT